LEESGVISSSYLTDQKIHGKIEKNILDYLGIPDFEVRK